MAHAISELIRAASAGESGAIDSLFGALYAELRQLAHARLRSQAGPAVLDTTGLVHESFLRLVDRERLELTDRRHFLAYAGRVMRSVVVDLVRENQALRRGGGVAPVTLDSHAGDTIAKGDEVLRVHEALEELKAIDERLMRVVELRYFVGLEMSEIAEVLGVGKRTVERDWEKARTFLYASLHDS